MSHKDELKARVEAKRKELEKKLADLKVQAHETSNEEKAHLEAKLEELKTNLKDGWDNVSEQTAAKLNEWLK